jgi:hypothetical protein
MGIETLAFLSSIAQQAGQVGSQFEFDFPTEVLPPRIYLCAGSDS